MSEETATPITTSAPVEAEQVPADSTVVAQEMQQPQGQNGNTATDAVSANDDDSAKRSAEYAQGDEENPTKRPNAVGDTTMAAPTTVMSSNPNNIPPAVPEGMTRAQVTIPDDQIGRLIGKGGSNLKFYQGATNTTIFIPQTVEEGATDRVISITGDVAGVTKCKEMIEKTFTEEVPGEQVSKVVKIPDEQVGLLIGKGGSTIRHLQELSGAHIDIAKACNEGESERDITVYGEEKKVDKCCEYIRMKLSGEQLPNLAEVGTPGLDIFIVKVPNYLVGRVIGRGGQTAREIQRYSKVYLDIEKFSPEGSSHRNITVRGPPRQVAMACQYMNNILCEATHAMYQYVEMPPEIAAVAATLPASNAGMQQGGNMYGGYNNNNNSGYQQQQQQQQQYYGGYNSGYNNPQAQMQQPQYYQQYAQYGQQQQQQPQQGQQGGYDYSQYYQQQGGQQQQSGQQQQGAYDPQAYQQQYAAYYQQQGQGQ